jgi:hypothetical protein
MPIDHRPLTGWCLGIAAGLAAVAGVCGEGGGSNYLPGFYGDFGMGVMPDHGTFLNNFAEAYRDRAGDYPAAFELPGILHVTDHHWLGGRYIVGFYPGLAGMADPAGSRVGLADSYLMPVALNWYWGKLAVLAYEGIIIPTGRYRKGELNAGRNLWTFDHILSLSYTLPLQSELSVTVGYMNNLENTATHYRSGDEFHFDYLLGHYLRPDVGLGIAGSWYRQTTADRAPAGTEPAPFGEAATIGPALMLMPRLGGRDVTLSFKWLHEFGVSGRPPGDYLVWRAFLQF